MGRRLTWLVSIVLVLAAGYGVMVAVYPDARPSVGAQRPRARAGEAAPVREQKPEPASYEEISVSIEIPAAAEVPTGGPHGGNCPQDQLCNILGVTLAKPHGLVIESVAAEGPAARAGIEPGDHLGTQRDCPSTSLDRYRPHSQPRQVEVTVRRPASSTPQTPLAEESASREASEE